MSAGDRNPNDCIHCGGWTCSYCKPPHDPGEQGLTAEEKELVALRRRVAELEGRDAAIRNIVRAAAKYGWHPTPQGLPLSDWLDAELAKVPR